MFKPFPTDAVCIEYIITCSIQHTMQLLIWSAVPVITFLPSFASVKTFVWSTLNPTSAHSSKETEMHPCIVRLCLVKTLLEYLKSLFLRAIKLVQCILDAV